MEFSPEIALKIGPRKEKVKGRLARMIYELLRNRELIEKGEKGHVQLHFAGDKVVFKITISP